MNIALSQQNYHIGNFEANVAKIVADVRRAKAAGADLVVFSELCVCGYPPRDFLEFNDFILRCENAVETIAAEADSIAILVGAPARNASPLGKDLHNAVYFLNNKKVEAVIAKTLLPNYDIFDEYRYFEPANTWQTIDFKGKKLAVTICEDIWDLTENPLYLRRPLDELQAMNPDIVINLSASPFNYVHAAERRQVVQKNVARYGLPLIYCNTVGAQTDLIFDGGSLVMDRDGNDICTLAYFEEDFALVHWDEHGTLSANAPAKPETRDAVQQNDLQRFDPARNIPQVHQALILGIRDYFRKMSFTQAVVASSGGIDSALVLALASEALGAENVTAILLPSQFSTDHSVSDAEKLSQNLGNPYRTIPIKDVFGAYETALAPVFEGLAFSVAEENLQSRIRGAMVMAVSNKFGSILLNTSNKSELATGYGTLYGDMAGGLGILGDLYKMQIYALARYINRDKEIIPQNILEKAPSAELRPGQKDSDSLPPYEILDAVLYQYIEQRKGPNELIDAGFEPQLVARILKLANTNEYKRNQFCPILRVSFKAFGSGRRMPIVGKYLS